MGPSRRLLALAVSSVAIAGLAMLGCAVASGMTPIPSPFRGPSTADAARSAHAGIVAIYALLGALFLLLAAGLWIERERTGRREDDRWG